MAKDIVMLAEEYQEGMNPVGWYLSEKIDGFRSVWSGTGMMSRNSNGFAAPSWFLKGLPGNVPLDGELSAGRKLFQKTSSIVRGSSPSAWKDITYFVFDIPVDKIPFEERQKALAEYVRKLNLPHIQYVPQSLCSSVDFFDRAMKAVLAAGGEGLMLRKAGSMYVRGRSSYLLKAKPWYDAEAIVRAYEEGENSFTGIMGALHCETVNGPVKKGMMIKVGTGFTIKQRENPPPIGTMITYRYRKLSDSGKPVHPAFLRVYKDI